MAQPQCRVLVTGGAIRTEALGEQYARKRGHAVKQYLADWEQYGRGAKVIRNTQLIEVADRAVLFWDGKHKGVRELIEKAEAKGISVEVVRFGA